MISGILLAGGDSRRMGTNKAFLQYKGKKLFEYPLAVLEELSDDILISAPEGIFPHDFRFRVIPDICPGSGPLGGIFTCLKEVKNDKSIVLSCDIPFITPYYIRALLNESGDVDIVAGTNRPGLPEPLAAIYSSHLWPAMEEAVKNDRLKTGSFLRSVRTRLVDTGALGFDPDRLFFNVNNPDDFAKLGEYEN